MTEAVLEALKSKEHEKLALKHLQYTQHMSQNKAITRGEISWIFEDDCSFKTILKNQNSCKHRHCWLKAHTKKINTKMLER